MNRIVRVNSIIKSKEKICQFIPWIFLFTGYLLTIVTFYFSGKLFLNGDDCTEWVLAKHLNQTGRFISADWYYGTELHVFFSQILHKLLLHFFTNWHLARTVSVALFLALIIGAALQLCKELNVGNSGVYAVAALVYPFGSLYCYFVLYSGFYNFYLALFFIIVCLQAVMLTKRGSRFYIALSISVLLSFLSGLNGVRFLIILFFPMFAAVSLELLRRMKGMNTLNGILGTREGKHFVFVCLESVACAAGWILNEKYLSYAYSFWTYKNNNLQTFYMSDFLNYCSGYLYIFGYEGIQDFSSYQGIGQLFSLILIILLIFMLGYGIRHRGDFHSIERLYLELTTCALCSNALIFYLGQQAERRFLVLAAPLVFPATAILWNNMKRNHDELRRRLSICVFITCILVQSISTAYIPGFLFERNGKSEEEMISDFLVDNGYSHAMTSFYPGAYFEYLSDGKLEIWILSDDMEEKKYKGLSWEQPKSHLKAPEDNHAALIVRNHSEQAAYNTDSLPTIFSTENYEVYDVPNVTDIFLEQ